MADIFSVITARLFQHVKIFWATLRMQMPDDLRHHLNAIPSFVMQDLSNAMNSSYAFTLLNPVIPSTP